MQQAWRRVTDEEEGVDAIGAVAGKIDMTGVGGVETVEAAGTVAGVEATEAEAGVKIGATDAEAEAGVLVAETVAAAQFTGKE